MHESQMHEKNCFITLTFDDEHVDPEGSLRKIDFQNFMKRFRKKYFGSGKSDVRYFHCGEYGGKLGRPHHHAIIFNFNFADKVLLPGKKNLYRSSSLESLWEYGFSSIGSCTYASACYVAQYVVKKVLGKNKAMYYGGKVPEYTSQSLGIGKTWYEKYGLTDVYPQGYTVMNGQKGKPTRYYEKKYKLTNPDEYEILKSERKVKALANVNNHPDRLRAAEQIQKARDSQKERKL